MIQKNFALMIPKDAYKREIMEEDPLGAPIYAPCPAGDGLCACTGACRKVIGHSQDPEDLRKYREYIDRCNNFIPRTFNSKISEEKDGIRVWTFETE